MLSARQLRTRFGPGARAGAPYALAAALVAASFGVLAEPVFGGFATVAFSAIVFAGSAQFAALAVLADGGGAGTAIVAGILLNARFVTMGIAFGPSTTGGWLARALQGQAVVDASWALANRGGGRFDRDFLLGSTALAYPAWVLGTLVGVLVGDRLGSPQELGLDALFPAFFLGLLVEEIRDRVATAVALLGAVIALALTPIAPPGIPILAASLAVLIGAWRR
ncbi:MAG TPA: AzlC family ABC transporter permease [Thermoleophilaceae bacterium]